MWVLLTLLLVLIMMNPPISMTVWNKIIIICAIIVLTHEHVLLGLIAAAFFIYKLNYRESVDPQNKPMKREWLGVEESLRPKQSNCFSLKH